MAPSVLYPNPEQRLRLTNASIAVMTFANMTNLARRWRIILSMTTGKTLGNLSKMVRKHVTNACIDSQGGVLDGYPLLPLG